MKKRINNRIQGTLLLLALGLSSISEAQIQGQAEEKGEEKPTSKIASSSAGKNKPDSTKGIQICHVITIDAKTGVMTGKPKSVRNGESVCFKFTNVNPLIARTDIATKAFNFEASIPDNVTEAVAGLFTKIDGKIAAGKKDTLRRGKTVENEQALAEFLTERNSIERNKNKLIENYDSIVNAVQRLSYLLKIEEVIRAELKDSIVNPTIVRSNIKGYLAAFYNFTDDSSLTPQQILKLRTYATQETKNIYKYYRELNYAYDTLSQTLQDEALTLAGDLKDDKTKTTLSITGAKVSVKRKKFFEEQFNYATRQYKLLTTDSLRLVKSINAGINLYHTIINSDFSVSDGPYEIIDDSKEFTPTLKTAKGKTIKEFKPITIKTYGRWKVDLSAGYAGSFIGDDDYSIFYDASGNVAGFKSNSPEYLTHSIVCMFNVYWQTRYSIHHGVSIGLSIPSENKFNFYAGYSIHALEKNRLVVTLGVSMVQVNRLNTSQLTVGEDHTYYTIPGNTLREAPYRKVYRPAAFFGITYNFATLKK